MSVSLFCRFVTVIRGNCAVLYVFICFNGFGAVYPCYSVLVKGFGELCGVGDIAVHCGQCIGCVNSFIVCTFPADECIGMLGISCFCGSFTVIRRGFAIYGFFIFFQFITVIVYPSYCVERYDCNVIRMFVCTVASCYFQSNIFAMIGRSDLYFAVAYPECIMVFFVFFVCQCLFTGKMCFTIYDIGTVTEIHCITGEENSTFNPVGNGSEMGGIRGIACQYGEIVVIVMYIVAVRCPVRESISEIVITLLVGSAGIFRAGVFGILNGICDSGAVLIQPCYGMAGYYGKCIRVRLCTFATAHFECDIGGIIVL